MTPATKTTQLDPAKLPQSILELASRVKLPTELQELLLLDDDAPPDITRHQLREIIAYAHDQAELDKTAASPSSVDPLSKKIDYNLNLQIDAITEENELLHKIAKQDPKQVFKVNSTGEVLTPAEARQKIQSNNNMLLEYKKHITDQRKAEQGPGNPNVAMSLNVDLGTIVSSTLNNIKDAQEAKIIDA